MPSSYRQYVTGENLEAFRAGLFAALKSDMRADVIRLSTRNINRRNTIVALIGVPGAPAGRNWELLAAAPQHVAGWADLGLRLGQENVEPWLAPDVQSLVQQAARLEGHDAWGTHEFEELAQDAVDEWEATWRAHLHGKLHIKAKEALVRDFARAVMDVVDTVTKAAHAAETPPVTAEAPPVEEPTRPKRGRKKKAEANGDS